VSAKFERKLAEARQKVKDRRAGKRGRKKMWRDSVKEYLAHAFRVPSAAMLMVEMGNRYYVAEWDTREEDVWEEQVEGGVKKVGRPKGSKNKPKVHALVGMPQAPQVQVFPPTPTPVPGAGSTVSAPTFDTWKVQAMKDAMDLLSRALRVRDASRRARMLEHCVRLLLMVDKAEDTGELDRVALIGRIDTARVFVMDEVAMEEKA